MTDLSICVYAFVHCLFLFVREGRREADSDTAIRGDDELPNHQPEYH